MFHCTVRPGGAWGDGGLADLWRKEAGKGRGGEREATGLDRFQWNRRLGGAEGTCNGKRVERLIGGWGGQVRDLCPKRVLLGVSREPPGGEREAEGSARWKGMMSGGAGEKDGEVAEVRARARVRVRARAREEDGREKKERVTS